MLESLKIFLKFPFDFLGFCLVSEEVGKIIEILDIVTKLKDFGSIFQDFRFVYAQKKKKKKKKLKKKKRKEKKRISLISYCHEVKIFHLVFSAYASLRENQGKGKKTKVI
jgi:Na+/phosphate symporter